MDRIILIKQKAKSKGRRIEVAMDSSNERYSTGVRIGTDIIRIIYQRYAK